MDKITNNNHYENNPDDEEINFSAIFNFFNRNKIFLSKISSIFLILGFLYSLTLKKTWEGQFQIVLKLGDKQTTLSSFNPLVKRLGGSSLGENDLKTEVGILESPSVLMPVYEFMKSKKNDSKEYGTFFSWKNQNLTIGLKDDTSILNITYRDQDKDMILPVLEKMSSSYQKYSGIRQKNLLKNSKNYLEEQIEIYKNKSATSLKAVQEFAIDEDLFYFDQSQNTPYQQFSFPLRRDSNIQSSELFKNEDNMMNGVKEYKNDLSSLGASKSSLFLDNIGIENVRVQAANEIRKIEIQLKKIAELNDYDEFQYIGSTIPALVEAGMPQTLQSIENELAELRSKYTDQDFSIKRLLDKRKITIDLLKKRTINYLKAKKLELEAKMESAIRPKGVLLKYKELLRNSYRDEQTLIDLENQLRFNQLEEYREKDPWELITRPRLLNAPVSPKKSEIIMISLIIGLIFGSAYIFYKEKVSDNIFELKQIQKLLSFKFVEEIFLSEKKENINNLFFIRDFINKKGSDKVNIVILGDLAEYKIEKFKEILLKKLNMEIVILRGINDIKKDSKEETNIIVTSLGVIPYKQIKLLKKYQELFNMNISGLILLNK